MYELDRSARALTDVQRLNGLGDARCAGFRLLSFLYPVHPLFSVGVGQPIEECPRGAVARERVREVGWDRALPRLDVLLDIDRDSVTGGDSRCLAVLFAERHEIPSADRRDRGPVGVPSDSDLNRRTLACTHRSHNI